jgi:hypothetical protein
MALGIGACLLPAAQAQPLITLMPQTATTLTVPANGTAMVRYLVSNQSAQVQQYAMLPIQGVNQVEQGGGRCPQLIVLAPQSGSCVLELQVVGSQLPAGGVSGGPVLCRQGAPTQCVQPSAANTLQITLGPPMQAVLEVTPSVLVFPAGTVAALSVANVGTEPVAAGDIQVAVPKGIAIKVDPGTCDGALAPKAECQLLLAAVDPQPQSTLVVQASNAAPVQVQVTVTDVLFADGFEL